MTRRQRVRSALLFSAFLLFPIVQFYFSPYIIVDGAMEGIVAGSAIVFAVQLLLAIFIGRAICGWAMPCGGMQEMCFGANDRRVRGVFFDLIKWFLWVPWMALVIYGFIHAGGIFGVEFLRKIDYGISISQPVHYTIYYGVILIFVVLSFAIGRRASCHYICWMSPFMIIGRGFRNLLRLPALQLKLTGTECIECGLCTKVCPMSLDVQGMVLSKKMENYECILCTSCIDACRKKVIKLSFGKKYN